MSDIKQPSDHKPKPANGYQFNDTDGKPHTLPLASKGRAKMFGRDIRDAALGGEVGQLAYLFKVLEAAGPAKKALDALYDMPQDDMVDILQAWGEYGDGDGASLGK